MGKPTPEIDAVPPDGCICASFWTVRRTHKKDCPLAEIDWLDKLLDETFGLGARDHASYLIDKAQVHDAISKFIHNALNPERGTFSAGYNTSTVRSTKPLKPIKTVSRSVNKLAAIPSD